MTSAATTLGGHKVIGRSNSKLGSLAVPVVRKVVHVTTPCEWAKNA